MVNIRPGNEKDLGSYFELYWMSSIEHEDYSNLDKLRKKEDCKKAIIKQYRKRMRNKEQIFLIAEQDNRTVGIVIGHSGKRDEPVFAIENFGYIDELFVIPSYRGKGLGKLLVDEMTVRLLEFGVDVICLAVAARNPAVKFHEALGFEIKSILMTKIMNGDIIDRKLIQSQITKN
jgi:ribosomal protein S18 acetylase RimI-like enzyme